MEAGVEGLLREKAALERGVRMVMGQDVPCRPVISRNACRDVGGGHTPGGAGWRAGGWETSTYPAVKAVFASLSGREPVSHGAAWGVGPSRLDRRAGDGLTPLERDVMQPRQHPNPVGRKEKCKEMSA